MGCCIPTFSALEWLIQFGKSEHTGLTRWHDPKEELPEYVKVVEVKYKAFNKIMMAIAFRLGDLWSGKNKWCIDGTSVRIDHDWAVESDCENYDIKIRAFIDGWGDITSDIEELGIVKKERPEIIVIDI